MDIVIPDSFWGPAGTLLGAAGVCAGLFKYGASIMCWWRRTVETPPQAAVRHEFEADEAVKALERRMYFDRAETEKRLDTMERTFATKDELAAVEQRLRSAVGDLRDDVRDLTRHIADHSTRTTENLHRLIGDVAEIKGHLGKGSYKQEG
jgi:hypothetical protein